MASSVILSARDEQKEGLMVQVSSDEVGRALYHLLKSGKGIDQLQPQGNEVRGELRKEIRRIVRQHPDGSMDIVEQEISTERLY